MNTSVSKQARRHLQGADPVLGPLAARLPLCALTPQRGYFMDLCKAIISQQISVCAAAAVFARFRALFSHRLPTPAKVLACPVAQLKTAGLSQQKCGYLCNLARHFATGEIMPRRISAMDDEQVIKTLTAVKGIGRWTAEMFLIFTLARPDVFSLGDYGLRSSCQKLYGNGTKLTNQDLLDLSARWKPFRSYASLYLWASLGAAPFWRE